ncbi:MAG: hypothetical protein JXA42_18720 [Anaerolineales bacterium]|nr:hypothetical protein [Anaerolineales bacterium]
MTHPPAHERRSFHPDGYDTTRTGVDFVPIVTVDGTWDGPAGVGAQRPLHEPMHGTVTLRPGGPESHRSNHTYRWAARGHRRIVTVPARRF